MDNQKTPQKRTYETTRSSPATKEHGVQIRSRIEEWEKDPDGQPPTLKELAEELNLSRERVRQICVQEGIGDLMPEEVEKEQGQKIPVPTAEIYFLLEKVTMCQLHDAKYAIQLM